jgi:hypothetical protein
MLEDAEPIDIPWDLVELFLVLLRFLNRFHNRQKKYPASLKKHYRS